MLRLTNVNCYYGLAHVLKNVSLHVKRGEVVTLIGANGAGKSTILRAVSGLHPVRKGDILFDGEGITGVPAQKRVPLGIAQVPEGRQIFRPMTVFENLELGGFLLYRSQGKKALRSEIERMYAIFPKLSERKTQYAGTLSGGEQQMLAIAMALMARPRLLLLDEPSMGLAPLIVKEIFRIVERLREERDLTVLLIEQNANAALGVSDRGYVIETGRIIMEERADALMTNPEVRRAYLGKEKKEIWE